MLETARLSLRPLVEADLPALIDGVGRPEVARWLIRVPHPYTEADARAWLRVCTTAGAAGTLLHRVALPRGGDRIVGAVSLVRSRADAPEAELGYWLAPEVWGRGYGTEMASALVAAGFRDLGLIAVRAAAEPGNTASNRVLAKAGLMLERVDPAHDRGLRGPPGPANLWRITRTEWERMHGR
ncbi:GNAT family N-acetyltransferase [Rhodospirillum centenum]|uniref:GNAT family N-acetyltransferase n=1 Tax=Rhodospirillum centenum TaxID=34018 RepID=UPI0002DB7165|nr:GNAT family N-acetyltransferase [Rhodospirillum centenum]